MFTRLLPGSSLTSVCGGSIKSLLLSRAIRWFSREPFDVTWLGEIWLRNACEHILCKSTRSWKMSEKWKVSCFSETLKTSHQWSGLRLHTLRRKFSFSVVSLTSTWLQTWVIFTRHLGHLNSWSFTKITCKMTRHSCTFPWVSPTPLLQQAEVEPMSGAGMIMDNVLKIHSWSMRSSSNNPNKLRLT